MTHLHTSLCPIKLCTWYRHYVYTDIMIITCSIKLVICIVQVLCFTCTLEVSSEVINHIMCASPYIHTCILMMNKALRNGGIHHIAIKFCTNSLLLVRSVVTVSSFCNWSTLAKAPANATSKRKILGTLNILNFSLL